MKKGIMKILNVLVLSILMVILFVNSVILLSSIIKPEEVPSFFGWKPFITLSGSMESEIYAGDLAVVKEIATDELKKGDVIAFRQDDIVITHRIDDIVMNEGERKFVTKGDNNNTTDVLPVSAEMIEGKYMFKISKLGNVAMFIQTPTGMVTVLAIPVLLLVLIQINKNKQDKEQLNKKVKNEKKMQAEIERLKEENRKLAEKK